MSMNSIWLPIAALLALAICVPPVEGKEFSLERGQTAIGSLGEYSTEDKDTLMDVARSNDLGYTELVIVNPGVNPWVPGQDKRIIVPGFYLLPDGPRRGIVLNLPEQRVFYFPPGGDRVETYPIGAGVEGRLTPLGVTHIVSKQVHPGWSVPASIRRERPELPAYVPPGPDNPMGDLAMGLAWSGFYLHGTNKPDGVGRNVSHGCIHFYPEDIDRLFHEVGIGTSVRVIDQEVMTGWINNQLYVAVFPNKQQVDQIDIEQPMTRTLPADLVQRVRTAAGDHADEVDWALVTHLGLERRGIPTAVTPQVEAADEQSPEPDQSPVASMQAK